MDCCLVNMPYAPVAGPSLGLGLLQSILQQGGIPTTTLYANIEWCETIGLHQYDIGHDLTYLFGDWVFAHIAFPEFHPDSERYLDQVFHPGTLKRLGITRRDRPGLIASLRGKAAQFIDDTAARIIAHHPLFVGCSSTFVGHVSSLSLLKRIKDLAPGIATVLGGANCESVMGLTTHEHFPWIDYVVSGEADTIVVDLARGIEQYGREMPASEVPDGVIAPVHRTMGYWGLRDNPPRAFTRSLDELPVPHFGEFFSTLKAAPTVSQVVRPGLPVEGSRGCWWGERNQCVFCGMSELTRTYRTKSPQRVLGEMEELQARYGPASFGFVDMIVHPAFFRDFFTLLGKDQRPWILGFETTPSISAEKVRMMAEAGVTCVQPGIESLDPGVLTLLNKGSKAWQNVRFLKWCRYYGIHASWVILVDIPGEDHGWYARTAQILPSLHHLQPPKGLNPIVLSRFSKYHQAADTYNLRLAPAPPYSFIYPLPEHTLMDLCYFFQEQRSSDLPESVCDEIDFTDLRWGGLEGRCVSPPNPAATCGLNSCLRGEATECLPKLSTFMVRCGAPCHGRSHARDRIARTNRDKEALTNAVVEWIRRFDSDARPVLEAYDTGTEITFRDTREVAWQESFTLSGIERDVYNACENGVRLDSLCDEFQQNGHGISETEKTLHGLIAKHLVLLLDNHLLALGLPRPLAEIPRYPHYPYGSIDRVLYAALIAARRITL